MFKREIKTNFKSFLIWLIVTLSLLVIVYLVYPIVLAGPEAKQLNDMMKVFPADILKLFNMDISSIDSVYGWLKSEGYVFLVMIISSYSALLGANILVKEENDKTIEYLGVTPIKRNDIVIKKSLVGILYVIAFNLVLLLFNLVCLLLSGDLDITEFILVSISPLFPCIILFFMCMFISTFSHKSKQMLGITLGIVFFSNAITALAKLSVKVDFLKYFSVYTLADIRNVILHKTMDPYYLAITIALSIAFLSLTMLRYNKKELL